MCFPPPKPSANNVLHVIRPLNTHHPLTKQQICQRIVNRQFFLNKKYCVLIGRAHVFPGMHGISLVERHPTGEKYEVTLRLQKSTLRLLEVTLRLLEVTLECK